MTFRFRLSQSFEPLYLGGTAILSKDGSTLYSSLQTKIVVYDVHDGKVKATLDMDDKISSFVLDGQEEFLIATCHSLLMHVWDLKEGKVIKSWKAHEGPVQSMDVDPSNTLVASGSSDFHVKLWDFKRGFCTHNFKGHKAVISIVKWDEQKDKWTLFSGASDGSIRVWNVLQKQCVAVLESHTSSIQGLHFNGKALFSASRDQTISKWDVEKKKVIVTYPLYESVERMVMVDDVMATVGEKGILKLWKEGKEICASKKEENCKSSFVDLSFNAETNQFMVLTNDHNLMFFDRNAGAIKQIIGFNDEITDLSFLEHGKKLIVSTNSEQLKLVDLSTNSWKMLWGHSGIVLCLAFSADNNLLLSGSKDNTARLWRISNDSIDCIAECKGHVEAVSAVAISSNNLFVTGSEDRTIKLWDYCVETGMVSVKYTKSAHEKDLNCLAFSADSKKFASASQDKTVKIWESSSGNVLGILKGHKRGVWAVEFSQYDPCVVTSSGDKTIKLWSLNDFSCLKTFEGHSNSVLRVHFINKGSQLVSSGSDGLVKVWSIKGNECLTTLDKHTDKVWALNVSEENRLMISSAGSDSIINIWEDCTAEEIQKQFEEKQLFIEKDQKLSNYLVEKDYRNAVIMAMELDQPSRLYSLFKMLFDSKQENVVHQLLLEDNLLSDSAHLNKMLVYLADWNTQSKKSVVAQRLLFLILSAKKKEEILELPDVKKIIMGLLPYSERHLKRIDELIIESFILDFALSKMNF